MILKFLFNVLVFVITGANPGGSGFSVVGPNTSTVNESSPSKLSHTALKKDSVSQTQTPIVIFKLINSNHQSGPKNTGSLKNAGKMARTANNAHVPSGKI